MLGICASKIQNSDGQKKKKFFFEKKNQKTFLYSR